MLGPSGASRFIPYFIKSLSFLKPLAPTFLRWAIKRRIEGWKRQGMLESYNLKVKKAGKLHYRMELEVIFEETHLRRILQQPLLPKNRKRFVGGEAICQKRRRV